MEYTEDTPRSEITVQGLGLTVPTPFTEGHVLAENEAKVLNQTLAENLRNNFAKTVKAAIAEAGDDVDAVDIEALQAKFDEYIVGYEFGVRSITGRTTRDPIERQIIIEAKSRVKEALRANGIAIKSVTTEQLNNLVDQLVERDAENLREAAVATLEAKKAAAESVSEKLDLGSLQLA